jgi:hypothetical protein
MAAAASSARALILLLRPRQHLLPLRVHFAFAAARLPERRCFLLLQQQPHRCWAAIGAAASRGGSRCGDGYPQPQAPAVCPEGAPTPPAREEGEAACGSEKAAGTWHTDDDAGKGAAPPSAPYAAVRAASGRRRRSSSTTPPKRRPAAPTARQANRAAALAKRKGKKGGPAPPSGGRKEGRGGQGGVHN